jgi:hypothetical protein
MATIIQGSVFIGDSPFLTARVLGSDGTVIRSGQVDSITVSVVEVETREASLYDSLSITDTVFDSLQIDHGCPSGSVTDPTGAASGSIRVRRGGSWIYNSGFCRSAFRNWYRSWRSVARLEIPACLPAGFGRVEIRHLRRQVG